MLIRILQKRSVQFALSALIILGALFCIFTPNYFLFKMGARFAGLIMLGYLAMGILFLLLKQPRLMFISMACCGGLCLFLKHSSNSDLKYPIPTTQESVKVAHFNVSASDDDYESTIQAIIDSKADLISIQEVTPDWHYILKETLSKEYPHSAAVVRFDPYGLAVYSKYPISNLDTFYYESIPNFSGIIELNDPEHRFNFICAHTTPPLYSQAYQKMRDHLRVVAAEAIKHQEDSMGVMMISNLNAPPWWGEIQELREAVDLYDSRRSASYGLSEIFQSPGDYIFHTIDFNCLGFESIISPQSSHLGIQGLYQFKTNAEKTYR